MNGRRADGFKIFCIPMSGPYVTFVSHEATLTGAPVILHLLLKYLDLSSYEVDVLLLRGGQMEQEFAKLYPTSHYDLAGALPKSPSAFGANRAPDLFYLNSHSYEFLHTAKALQVPVICHVHEGEMSFSQLSSSTRSLLCDYPQHYIVISEYVKEVLCDKIGVDEKKVTLVRNGIECSKWKRSDEAIAGDLRNELGIPENALIVGGSGSIHPRKGVDLWLQMAEHVQQHSDQPVHFVWVGGTVDHVHAQLIKQDVERMGMDSIIHFVGEQKDPKPYYELFDVFALSCRQEPFGLVSIENMLLGTPVVAFEAAGGPLDILNLGIGIHIVPSLDTEAMANKVSALLTHPEPPENCSIIEEHYDICKMATKICPLIDAAMTVGSRSLF